MKDEWTFFYFHSWITLQISRGVSSLSQKKWRWARRFAPSEIRMYIEVIHQLSIKLCLEKNSTASKQNLGCVSPILQIFANIYYKCCKLGLELVYGHFHWCCYYTAPVIYTYQKFVGVIDHATTITSKARERGNSTAHLFSKKKNSIWK